MKLADMQRQARERHKADAAYGWDASPISTSRLAAEVWAQIKNEDWSYVTEAFWIREWPHRLWKMDKNYRVHRRFRRRSSRLHGRRRTGRSSREQEIRTPDGCDPARRRPDGRTGVLWTAAHHKIPILYIMHNNRAYHQEVMESRAWQIAVSVASIEFISAPRSTIRTSISRSLHRAWASKRKARLPIPRIWRQPSGAVFRL